MVAALRRGGGTRQCRCLSVRTDRISPRRWRLERRRARRHRHFCGLNCDLVASPRRITGSSHRRRVSIWRRTSSRLSAIGTAMALTGLAPLRRAIAIGLCAKLLRPERPMPEHSSSGRAAPHQSEWRATGITTVATASAFFKRTSHNGRFARPLTAEARMPGRSDSDHVIRFRSWAISMGRPRRTTRSRRWCCRQ